MRRLRGRPRHNDVLTPREWEVLSLLREGLTNEQIALRLNITFDTAKFHVSEILGKLGVDSRQEAAAWRGQPRGVPAAAPSIWQRAGLTTPVRVIAATAVATVAIGLLALAGGLLLMSARDADEPSTNVEARTGDEALDILIDAVLIADAASLATRFAGVDAREGEVVGGPIGIYQPVTLTTAEWTGRLAASRRDLYAVVKAPAEPFAWNQYPVPALPRASVFAGARDYDVLLIVGELGLQETPWRLSIQDGAVVDIVIDTVRPSRTLQPTSTRPLLARLANLMPSLDTHRSAFVIAPPEEMWPPPVPQTGVAQYGSGPPGPAGVMAPALAPDGRTGLPELNAAIDALVKQTPGQLRQTFSGLAGTQESCEPDPAQPSICNTSESRVPLDDWTERLASGKPALYSVYTYSSDDIAIVIAIDGGATAAEAWRFIYKGGKVVELSIQVPLSVSQPVGASPDYWSRVRSMTPQPDYDYERFFILPPLDRLPSPPRGYALSTRTADPGVDALLSVVEAGSQQDLVAALATPDGTLFRGCRRYDETLDSAGIAAWAATTLPIVFNLASVTHLPAGYHPTAEHLIVFRTQLNPLLWSGFGLVEQDGKIIAVFDVERGCQVEVMYPPPSYIVPPPPGGAAGLDPARRSEIPLVDAVLDAGYAGDADALDRLISYRSAPCGIEFAPECPAGLAPGTLVEGLSSTACHGGHIKRDEAPAALIQLIQSSALYGITPQGITNGVPDPLLVLMVSTKTERQNPASLVFDATSVVAISRNCSGLVPDWTLGGRPNFLLPPP